MVEWTIEAGIRLDLIVHRHITPNFGKLHLDIYWLERLQLFLHVIWPNQIWHTVSSEMWKGGSEHCLFASAWKVYQKATLLQPDQQLCVTVYFGSWLCCNHPFSSSQLVVLSWPDVPFMAVNLEDLEVTARISLQISLWLSLWLAMVNA